MTLGFVLTVILVLVIGAVLIYLSDRYIPTPWKWIPIGLLLLILIFWFYAMVTGGYNFNGKIR